MEPSLTELIGTVPVLASVILCFTHLPSAAIPTKMWACRPIVTYLQLQLIRAWNTIRCKCKEPIM